MIRKLSPSAVSADLSTLALLGAATLSTGCATGAADMLEITLLDDLPVSVDTVCTDTPCEGDGVEAELTFDPALGADDEAYFTVEQYRVDYTFVNTGEEAPFYADDLDLEIVVDETMTFSFDAAGSAQRAWVYGLSSGDEEAATAVLTLAGYDQDDQVFEISHEFPVVFEDLSSSSDDASDTGA